MWPRATADTFAWAVGAVRTRGFHFGGGGTTATAGDDNSGPYMLPAIDMLNHSRANTATSLCVDGGAASGALSPGAAVVARGVSGDDASALGEIRRAETAEKSAEIAPLTFSMVAERDVRAGEEITHTYDALDNAHLLMTYGAHHNNSGSSSSEYCIIIHHLGRFCRSASGGAAAADGASDARRHTTGVRGGARCGGRRGLGEFVGE